MRFVIQRVKNSTLRVDNKIISEIGVGLNVYVGICTGDTEANVAKIANKIASLRIFEDENEKMNLSVKDVGGEILLVSNFTLCTIEASGNRPNFSLSADKDTANKLYLLLAEELRKLGVPTKLGVFAADMQIDTHLDGPINIYKEIN